MPMDVVPFEWVIENMLTAFIIVVYLYYEIHYGKVSKLSSHMDAIITVVLALARTSEDVDEQKVADRLNGHSPDDLMKDNG